MVQDMGVWLLQKQHAKVLKYWYHHQSLLNPFRINRVFQLIPCYIVHFIKHTRSKIMSPFYQWTLFGNSISYFDVTQIYIIHDIDCLLAKTNSGLIFLLDNQAWFFIQFHLGNLGFPEENTLDDEKPHGTTHNNRPVPLPARTKWNKHISYINPADSNFQGTLFHTSKCKRHGHNQ